MKTHQMLFKQRAAVIANLEVAIEAPQPKVPFRNKLS